MVTLDELRAAVERVTGTALEMSQPRWLSRFGNATRQAARYRAGRVLLAGDAAHVHFPAGGQGLNTGMQDAVNLGWKLAATVHGWAPAGLLDTYHDERHPVAAQVCHNTRAQLALMDPAEEITPLRELFAELMDLPQVNRHLAGMITGVDLRYDMRSDDMRSHDMPTLGDERHPLLGRRLPDLPLQVRGRSVRAVHLLRSGRGLLLDLTGDLDRTGDAAVWAACGGWADRVDVVGAQCGTQPPADALLVRPDGYVAWVGGAAGSGPGSLEDALTTWFGTRREEQPCPTYCTSTPRPAAPARSPGN